MINQVDIAYSRFMEDDFLATFLARFVVTVHIMKKLKFPVHVSLYSCEQSLPCAHPPLSEKVVEDVTIPEALTKIMTELNLNRENTD